MVYIISMNGVPLMPSVRNGHIRKLLKSRQAKVIKREPFTIQLLYDTQDIVQNVELKVDSGYLNVGVSACSDQAELYSAEIKLNPNIKNSIQDKRRYRRTRRNKLRYRKCRFDNRRRKDGWLPPSIQHKVDSHTKIVSRVASILPISRICIEVANFDTQKIKNPDIKGAEYQQGELNDFRNLREYVFFRDQYTCQICKKNAFEDGVILQMHHVEFWKDHNRANTPSNGLTVCSKCHSPKNHQPGGKLWGIEAKFRPLKDATYMATVRKIIVAKTRALFPDIDVVSTYGYQTKDKRITLGIEKSHANDAYCIGEKQPRERVASTLYYKQKSKNNRSLSLFYDAKYIDSRDGKVHSGKDLFSGRTRRNKNKNSENLHKYRSKKVKKGKVTTRKQHYPLQPFDTVLWRDRAWTVKGTHCNGTRAMLSSGKSVAIKDLRPISHAKTIYLEKSI